MRMCMPSTVKSAISACVGLLALAVPVRAVTINVGSAIGKPGDTVSIPVTLSTMSAQVAGTQNDLAFDPNTPVTGPCVMNPGFDNGISVVSLEPTTCTVEVENCGIRALLILDPPRAIPDGTVLYTCSVKIAADAPLQTFPITCSMPIATDPNNRKLSGVQCSDGQVQVALPTPTFTPTPTATPGGPTATPRPGGGGGGGGCEIAPRDGGSLGWPLWVCAVVPLWLWRRHRLPRARS